MNGPEGPLLILQGVEGTSDRTDTLRLYLNPEQDRFVEVSGATENILATKAVISQTPPLLGQSVTEVTVAAGAPVRFSREFVAPTSTTLALAEDLRNAVALQHAGGQYGYDLGIVTRMLRCY
jgi:hypothetical protein